MPRPAEAETPRVEATFSGEFWIMTVISDMVAHHCHFHPQYTLLPQCTEQQSRFILTLHMAQLFLLLLPFLWQGGPGPAQVTHDSGNIYNFSYFLQLEFALMISCSHQMAK